MKSQASETRAEAGRKGGRTTAGHSLAKANAVRTAQLQRARAVKARHSSLVVPEPFTSAADFLRMLHDLVRALPTGAYRDLARAANVSTSTVSKWLSGKKVPVQENLDKVVSWWRSNRDYEKIHRSPLKTRSPVSKSVTVVSLSRLPEDISARLRKAASFRNIQAIELAAQILDRRLPSLEEML